MRIDPFQAENFLKARGWVRKTLDQFPELWTFIHPLWGERQIFLPINEKAPDYEDALRSLILKLAAIEHTEYRIIADQLERTAVGEISSPQDGMAMRILKTIRNEESIPLSLAHAVIRETETILMSGSCMAENSQPFFRRIDNKISNEIRERAIFNHTRRGSFILSVSCPIAGVGEQLGFGFDSNQWTKSRRAFVAIYRGIKALTEAIESNEINRFSEDQLESESPIISSNFCEAFANIVSNDPGDGIKIEFDWSPYVPIPLDIDVETTILVTPVMSESLYKISEVLRPKESSIEDVFIGTVEALRGDVTSTGERAGAVEFQLLLKDGTPIRASAILTQEQYKLADEAHIAGARYISISGRLEPHPRVWTFEYIKSFSLVEE